MTGVCQSNQYVFGICQKKKPNAVYKALNMGFGIWLVYESHSKVIFLQTTVYRVVYEKFGIHAIYRKKPYKDVYQPFLFAVITVFNYFVALYVRYL